MHLDPIQFNLRKVAYTPNELIDNGTVGSRTELYRLVKAGRLRLTKRGTRTIFLADDVAKYLASLKQGRCATASPEEERYDCSKTAPVKAYP